MSDVQRVCCVCGALHTERVCLSCNHEECESCTVYARRQSYEALEAELAAVKLQLSQTECDLDLQRGNNDILIKEIEGRDALNAELRQRLNDAGVH